MLKSIFMARSSKRIYLDYASITPIDAKVLKAMSPYLVSNFFNPSSLYEEGRIARKAIEDARRRVAHALQSKAGEIFFTSGGTEANNIALQGAFRALQRKRKDKKKMHMITSSIEHSSVLEIFKYFETKGVHVTYLSTDEEGLLSPSHVIDSLRENTVLISLMYGNNEIGTINDISKIAKEVARDRKSKGYDPVLFHTDASQGACYLNIRADYLGVDLLTLDGSKLYGPRGVGALYAKRGTGLEPILFGGGHEEGIRPSTENTASIVGLAEALSLAEKEKLEERERLRILRDHAFQVLCSKIPDIVINGSETERLPNNINFCVPGIDSEFLVIKLDLRGIACSSVTTCRNMMDNSSSYVIEELDKARKAAGMKKNCSRSSLRLSIGRFTTKKELDQALRTIVSTIRSILR